MTFLLFNFLSPRSIEVLIKCKSSVIHIFFAPYGYMGFYSLSVQNYFCSSLQEQTKARASLIGFFLPRQPYPDHVFDGQCENHEMCYETRQNFILRDIIGNWREWPRLGKMNWMVSLRFFIERRKEDQSEQKNLKIYIEYLWIMINRSSLVWLKKYS